MNFSPSDMVSMGDILADVLLLVDDPKFQSLSRGWYTSQIQQALEELSFDTFFDKKLVTLEIPGNCRIEIPKGSFNIRQIYAFNGDNCGIHNSVNVYHKKNFMNSANGNSFVARNTGRRGDPFYPRNRMNNIDNINENIGSKLHYYAVQNGQVILSQSCKDFQKVLIEFNGVSCEIGDVPFVPNFARQAVKDWVAVKALPIKMKETIGTAYYNHWFNMLSMTKKSLEDQYDGSWVKTERRAKTLDSKYREDLKEYLTYMNY